MIFYKTFTLWPNYISLTNTLCWSSQHCVQKPGWNVGHHTVQQIKVPPYASSRESYFVILTLIPAALLMRDTDTFPSSAEQEPIHSFVSNHWTVAAAFSLTTRSDSLSLSLSHTHGYKIIHDSKPDSRWHKTKTHCRS